MELPQGPRATGRWHASSTILAGRLQGTMARSAAAKIIRRMLICPSLPGSRAGLALGRSCGRAIVASCMHVPWKRDRALEKHYSVRICQRQPCLSHVSLPQGMNLGVPGARLSMVSRALVRTWTRLGAASKAICKDEATPRTNRASMAMAIRHDTFCLPAAKRSDLEKILADFPRQLRLKFGDAAQRSRIRVRGPPTRLRLDDERHANTAADTSGMSS